MAKFNKTSSRPLVTSPVTSERISSGSTFEGAPGYARDAKSEFFLLAVANMVGENTFYEDADSRDARYKELVRQVAVDDPVWLFQMLRWLRADANLRSAPLVGACEAVKALLESGNTQYPAYEVPGLSDDRALNRALIDVVCQRADEPGELLAYWTSTYGRAIPKPVKRGVADAVQRLYNERSLLKYDTASKGFRFGDVIDLVHPSPSAPWQGDLFKHALDRRHGRDTVPMLPTLLAHETLMATPAADRRALLLSSGGPERFRSAGITWEALAGWLQGPMDAAAWEAVIPSMGVMALARNLRNFDQSGVSDAIAQQVAAKIADPAVIAKSRMFPFRFWAAFKHAPSLRWSWPLEQALTHSLANVPSLSGRTLILVDRSPSMFPGYYYSTPTKSDIPLAEQAAVFGAALAVRAEAPTLVEFGGQSRVLDVPHGGSVLPLIKGFTQIDGTDIPSAVARHYAGHDRVVIVTDEQTRPGWLPSNMAPYGGRGAQAIDDLIPAKVPVFMWNMAGYKHGALPSGTSNRYALGGLSDAAFSLIPLLDAGRSADWPWLSTTAA